MVFAGLLESIRVKKKALALNAHDAYYVLLKNVATGQEVDSDEAANIIDVIGKSEDDFESDVVIMETRFQLAGRLRESEAIAKSIPGLRETHTIAKDALEAAMRQLQPELTNAFNELQAAEESLNQFHGVGLRLAETCLDRSLLMRERENMAKRVELVDQRRPLSDDLTSAREFLSTCVAGIAGAKSRQKSTIRFQRDDATETLRKWTRSHESQVSIVDQLEKSVAEIDVLLQPLEQEFSKIRKQKLVP